jgi:hypothetical protein
MEEGVKMLDVIFFSILISLFKYKTNITQIGEAKLTLSALPTAKATCKFKCLVSMLLCSVLAYIKDTHIKY